MDMPSVPKTVAGSPACAVCLEPATGTVNVTMSAASSVPSVFESRCDVHNPMSAANRKAEAEQRVRDAAPAMLEALQAIDSLASAATCAIGHKSKQRYIALIAGAADRALAAATAPQSEPGS